MSQKFGDPFKTRLERFEWIMSHIQKAYDAAVKQLPEFIKNIWRFRRELWSHRWWDYSYTLMMLKRSIEIQADGMETKGYEVEESRNKKIAKMRRLCQIIDNIVDSNYVLLAEEVHGQINYKPLRFIETQDKEFYMLADDDTEEEKQHQRKVYKEANRIEEKEWKEFCEIIHGKKYKEYKDWDGSNLKTWWD